MVEYTCEEIEPVDEVKQTQLFGKYFCGVTGGESFETVQRVDPKTKLCPDGTKKCSEKTSDENTVCYPETEHELKCPITEILLVTGDDKAEEYWRSTDPRYKILQVDSES